MQAAEDTEQKRLGDYLASLRRHWLAFIFCALVVTALALAYLSFAPRSYQSTAAVLVTAPTSNGSSVDKTGTSTSTINLDTEAQLVTPPPTLDGVAKALHLSAADAAATVDNVSVTVPPSTEILDIAYTESTPQAAQKGALAYANSYLAQRGASAQANLTAAEKALQSQIDPLNAQLAQLVQPAKGRTPTSVAASRNFAQQTTINNQLSGLTAQLNELKATTVTPGEIVTQPALPTDPSSPNKLITLAAGLVLALLAGVAGAAFRNRSDDRVRNADDLFRRTRLPVLAVMSSPVTDGALVSPFSADGRGYARLRNLVTTGLEAAGERVLLVAGVERSSGPVVANLVASLARADEQVYLVCGDVFGTTARTLLDEEPAEGLAEVLAGERTVDEVVRSPADLPNLHVLPPGRDPQRADALLQTRTPRKLIDELLATGAYVVLDAPPTKESPDAQTLAHVARLAVIVVAPGTTKAQDALDAVAQLEAVHTSVLGAVVARYGRASASSARPKADAKAMTAPRPEPEAPEVVVPPAAPDEPQASPAATTQIPAVGSQTIEIPALGATSGRSGEAVNGTATESASNGR